MMALTAINGFVAVWLLATCVLSVILLHLVAVFFCTAFSCGHLYLPGWFGNFSSAGGPDRGGERKQQKNEEKPFGGEKGSHQSVQTAGLNMLRLHACCFCCTMDQHEL